MHGLAAHQITTVGGESTNKRGRLGDQDPVKRIDLFGKQLPLRLLAEVLSYADAKELGRSQTVCGGWRLSSSLLNRAWRAQYSGQWEVGSGELKEMAVGGAETPWMERYKRRSQTESDWRRGVFRQSTLTTPQRVVAALRVTESLIALGCKWGHLVLVDLLSMAVTKAVQASDNDPIYGLAHSGNLVFTGYRGGVRSWLLPELTLQRHYEGLSVTDVMYLATDGKLLVAACWDKTVRSWDLETREPRQTLTLHFAPGALAVDFKAGVAYAKLRNGRLEAVSLGSGQTLHLSPPRGDWHDLVIRPSFGDLLATEFTDCALRRLALTDLTVLRESTDGCRGRLALRSDSPAAALVSWDFNTPKVRLWDPLTLERVGAWDRPATYECVVATVTRLAAASFDTETLTVLDFSPLP